MRRTRRSGETKDAAAKEARVATIEAPAQRNSRREARHDAPAVRCDAPGRVAARAAAQGRATTRTARRGHQARAWCDDEEAALGAAAARRRGVGRDDDTHG